MPDSLPSKALQNESQYSEIQQTLSQGKRPPAALRMLMGLFERYRASRKIGWSRPWNKYGVRTFTSYRLDTAHEDELISIARALLEVQSASLPLAAQEFIEELWQEGFPPMGFLFLSEIEDGGQRYESATLSFGRVSPQSPRHRERLDIIVDCPVIHNRTQSPSRVRIIVDPDPHAHEALAKIELHEPLGAITDSLFLLIQQKHEHWSTIPDREWSHWSLSFVDYFGPRSYQLETSCFPAQPMMLQQAA